MRHHKHRGQMSEALLTAAFLSLSGGLQDAYTYIARDEVFANAQTGNIVLLSQNLFTGNWAKVPHYLVPLDFFALGIAASEGMRYRFQQARRIHWRQLVLLEEIVTLFAVGLMPASLNMLANAIVSFSCAMQVQAFRKVNGYAFASTMCIGNLRSGMDSLCAYVRTRNREPLRKAGHYFAIILFFALGAGLGGWGITQFGMRTIWLSCALLIVGFLLMFLKEDVEEIEEEIEALEQRK